MEKIKEILQQEERKGGEKEGWKQI